MPDVPDAADLAQAGYPVPLVPDQRSPFDEFALEFDLFSTIADRMDTGFSDWVAQALSTAGPRHRALDLGCGAGRYSTLLAEHYDKVLAVDTSKAMLDLAAGKRLRPNIDYQHRDALSVTPLSDGQADLVFTVHTLHHAFGGDPTPVLEHVRSLVAPGGTLIVADIVDPGGWETPQFHTDRAFTTARAAYDWSSDRRDALTTLGLLLHPVWLDMAQQDIPLTRPQFHHHYTRTFPGVSITDDLHPLMAGAVWHRPGPDTGQP